MIATFALGTSTPSFSTLLVATARNRPSASPPRIALRSLTFVLWVMTGTRNSRLMR